MYSPTTVFQTNVVMDILSELTPLPTKEIVIIDEGVLYVITYGEHSGHKFLISKVAYTEEIHMVDYVEISSLVPLGRSYMVDGITYLTRGPTYMPIAGTAG